MPRRTPHQARPQRPKPRHRPVGAGRTLGRGRSFRCVGCRLDVGVDAPGTAHRNHCPTCLTSRHVDGALPGDRAATCGGRMRPIAIAVRDDGEWRIVHRCRACGELRLNRIAGDDNPVALMSLALRPLAAPAAAAALGAVSAATPSRPTGSGPGASTTERGGHGVAGHRPTSE